MHTHTLIIQQNYGQTCIKRSPSGDIRTIGIEKQALLNMFVYSILSSLDRVTMTNLWPLNRGPDHLIQVWLYDLNVDMQF